MQQNVNAQHFLQRCVDFLINWHSMMARVDDKFTDPLQLLRAKTCTKFLNLNAEMYGM